MKLTDEQVREIFVTAEDAQYLTKKYNVKLHQVRAVKANSLKWIKALTKGLEKDSVPSEILSQYPNAGNLSPRQIRNFISKIIKSEDPNGCWLYSGKSKNNMGCPMHSGIPAIDRLNSNPKGHGREVTSGIGKMMQSKKVAYLLFIGPVPEGGCLAHNDYCKDHAFKACINPYHLVLTDQAGVMGHASERGMLDFTADTSARYLDKEVVTKIYTSTKMGSEISRETGVISSIVSNIRNHISYRYITDELEQPIYETYLKSRKIR